MSELTAYSPVKEALYKTCHHVACWFSPGMMPYQDSMLVSVTSRLDIWGNSICIGLSKKDLVFSVSSKASTISASAILHSYTHHAST